MNNIPEIVKTKAQELIDIYGDGLKHIGKHRNSDVYLFCMPEDVDSGFPFVYLHHDDNVQEITGFEALDIVTLLVKD